MKYCDYPALYRAADKSSINAQRSYLLLSICQYTTLVLASVIALFFDYGKIFLGGYVALVLATTIMMLYGTSKKLQTNWYRSRALAESIKTVTWRYMMRAEPYDRDLASAKRIFVKNLRGILESNDGVDESIRHQPSEGNQVTESMNAVRNTSLDERQKFYLKNRIDNQHNWYRDKAYANLRGHKFWISICVFIHLFAILLASIRIFTFDQFSIWPVHSMLVASSAIIGWMQIKKFNETAAAYSLATHEIGIIKENIEFALTESDFSEFVNDVELAFSREHTQWEARRKN